MRSDSVKNMSAYADQNHAPSLAAARLDCRKLKKGKVMAEIMEQVQKELASVIIGKKEVTDKILMAFLARGTFFWRMCQGWEKQPQRWA